MTGKKLNSFLSRGISGLSLAVIIAFGTASPVSAQAPAGAAGFSEMSVHDYLHRDIVLFAQALDMDEGQRVIVESLYEDYRASFDAGWARTQERFTDMRDDLQNADRDQVMALVLKPFEDWQRERDQIRENFEENVKVILNRQQLENWPAFQRQMVREKSLHRGRISGESLNLFSVLRDLRLDERMRMDLDNVMEHYDVELHEALLARNEALEKSQSALLQSIREQRQSAGVSRVRAELQRRVAVRDVNDHYIDVIADALPSDLGAEFRHNALERAYPRAFRPVPAVRMFEEAVKLEDLDSDTRQAIASLQSAMLDELSSISERLHQGIRDHEPRAMINQAEIAAARQTDEQVERLSDPNLRTYREREERVNHYVTELRELIGQEMFAELPGASRWAQRGRDNHPTVGGERIRHQGGRPSRGRDQATDQGLTTDQPRRPRGN